MMRDPIPTRPLLYALAAASLLGGVACQEVEQPTTVLTQAQWKEVQKNILTEDQAPTPQYKVGANFEDKIELVGFDVDGPLKAGEKARFTWYWKALEDIDENWQVFVHLDSNAEPYRQNLDHVPVGGMYQTSRWKKGQIIKDVQDVTLRADYPAGQATPYIGFWRGKSRMEVANAVPKTDEPQPRVIGPRLTVAGRTGAAAAKAGGPTPTYALRQLDAEAAGALTIDGKLDEAAWDELPVANLSPFGNAKAQASVFKAFLTDEHLVVGANLEDTHAWGTLKERDASTWTEEVVELFLDLDGDGKDYLELQVTPTGTIFDAHFPTRLGTGEGSRDAQIDRAKAFDVKGLESGVHVDGTVNKADDRDTSWSVELKIPLESLPGYEAAPKPGQTWAANVYRFDRPKEGTTYAYGWSTKPRGDFHQVDGFGRWKIASSATVQRPHVTPEMMQRIKENLDLRVRRPSSPALKMRAPVQGAEEAAEAVAPKE